MPVRAAARDSARSIGKTRKPAKCVNVFIHVRDIDQLFNSLDRSPFIERDLDPNAALYVVDWVKQDHAESEAAIEITLPQEAFANAHQLDLGEAIRNFFKAREENAQRELGELFAMGRRYIGPGALILLLCLFCSQALRGLPGDGPWNKVLEESFIILGWVADWKSIETFLYDWQPIIRRKRLFARLARTTISLKAINAA